MTGLQTNPFVPASLLKSMTVLGVSNVMKLVNPCLSTLFANRNTLNVIGLFRIVVLQMRPDETLLPGTPCSGALWLSPLSTLWVACVIFAVEVQALR